MNTSQENNILFGTDGWRGLLGSDLNDHNVALVAQAFADYLLQLDHPDPAVAIGFDGREGSGDFALLFARVLSSNHIKVYLSQQVIPTPVLSFYTTHHGCMAGAMITASHNPPQYNGIKFKSSLGAPLSTSETRKIEKLIDSNKPVREDDSFIVYTDFLKDYKQHINRHIDFKAIANSGIKPAIDSMAGAGTTILHDILVEHHIESNGIDQHPLPDFNGRMAEPIEQNLQPLADFLQNGDFSFGLATDGDADRLGVLDENGQWMNIQETILYLAEYVKTQREVEGGLVKTLSVTDKMKQLAQSAHCQLQDVQVGFKYVAETMIETRAAFGAEESGGFGFGAHIPERDGIYSALLFCEMVAKSGNRHLSAFIQNKRIRWGDCFYARIDRKYSGSDRISLLEELYKNPPPRIASHPVEEILQHYTSRGVINSLKFRLEGNPRWLLIRISETEPVVRIYAEGRSNQEVHDLLQEGQKLVRIQ
jgi:phosphomannomutase